MNIMPVHIFAIEHLYQTKNDCHTKQLADLCVAGRYHVSRHGEADTVPAGLQASLLSAGGGAAA